MTVVARRGELPALFRFLPEAFRHKVVYKHVGSSAGGWTRAAVDQHVDVHLETGIVGAAMRGGKAEPCRRRAGGPYCSEIVDRMKSATGTRYALDAGASAPQNDAAHAT